MVGTVMLLSNGSILSLYRCDAFSCTDTTACILRSKSNNSTLSPLPTVLAIGHAPAATSTCVRYPSMSSVIEYRFTCNQYGHVLRDLSDNTTSVGLAFCTSITTFWVL